MNWKTMLAYVTGSVDEELLRRNEYLVAENRILRAHLPGRLKLTDGERRTLAHIGKPLGRKALAEVANIVRPDTILGWPGGWSQESSMGQRSGPLLVGPRSTETWRILSSGWRRKTAIGATTVSPGLSPTSAMR